MSGFRTLGIRGEAGVSEACKRIIRGTPLVKPSTAPISADEDGIGYEGLIKGATFHRELSPVSRITPITRLGGLVKRLGLVSEDLFLKREGNSLMVVKKVEEDKEIVRDVFCTLSTSCISGGL